MPCKGHLMSRRCAMRPADGRSLLMSNLAQLHTTRCDRRGFFRWVPLRRRHGVGRAARAQWAALYAQRCMLAAPAAPQCLTAAPAAWERSLGLRNRVWGLDSLSEHFPPLKVTARSPSCRHKQVIEMRRVQRELSMPGVRPPLRWVALLFSIHLWWPPCFQSSDRSRQRSPRRVQV